MATWHFKVELAELVLRLAILVDLGRRQVNVALDALEHVEQGTNVLLGEEGMKLFGVLGGARVILIDPLGMYLTVADLFHAGDDVVAVVDRR